VGRPVRKEGRREVALVRPPPPGHWVGDGFAVKTYVSYTERPADISPFLLLDYAPPREFAPTRERLGVGGHPHRGFETVTIAYQGEVEHRDSAGNAGRIGPGDVQWMTAGAGVLHDEFHGRAFAAGGGTFEMAQIWVNLPPSEKRVAPRYQDLRAADFPLVDLPAAAGTARIVAGVFLGVTGPARTFTPVTLVNLDVRPGRAFDLPLVDGHTAMLLVRRGYLRVNDEVEAPELHLVQTEREGDHVVVEADEATQALLLSGAPIEGPVVGHGPFVMNSWAEILEAIEDVKRGKFGAL
jgi:redox-sensitive bicupin YhaK (pirin superfamily)